KRAYCLKIQPATGSFARNLIYSTKPLVWSTLHNVRISEDRLSRLLYTDDDDEEQTRLNHQIRDTDRPLALKAASIPFIRQFHLFINKNSHLKNIRVSDVMKIADSD
ncbi:DUF6387 family protein, partial [Klebsiella pneumoniae]